MSALDARVSLVAHADWSTSGAKRWAAIASRDGDSYRVHAPEPVGDAAAFLPALHARAGGGTVLVGFDFPIGVPLAFAGAARIGCFRDLLPNLGAGPWSRFYDPARERSEIGVTRPFYPFRGGGTAQSHLVTALGAAGMNDLLRVCERATPSRSAASPLFWTLGAKQVGRAAIAGWRDVIAPALTAAKPRTALWPFDGCLDALVTSHECVIAETYPAEAYAHLGLSRAGAGWSKRRQADRMRLARAAARWAEERGIRFSAALGECIADGFGPKASGEDPFDAVVGVLGMLAVVLGYRSEGRLPDETVRNIEGWIFGQDAH